MRARGKQGAASEPETDSLSDTSDTDKYAKRSDDSCSAGLSDGRALRWLLGAGVLTRFYGLAWPDEVVFDEVHFGKFITGYLTGQYFFDIHPPTGKLLIAAVAWASGFRGTQPFQKIGEAYRVGTNLFALRALPAAFGAALPPLLFSLARQLGCSSASSLLVGCLVLLDGATLVESRLLLTDSSLFFWEALQLLCALRASAAPANGAAFHAYLALTGVAIGAPPAPPAPADGRPTPYSRRVRVCARPQAPPSRQSGPPSPQWAWSGSTRFASCSPLRMPPSTLPPARPPRRPSPRPRAFSRTCSPGRERRAAGGRRRRGWRLATRSRVCSSEATPPTARPLPPRPPAAELSPRRSMAVLPAAAGLAALVAAMATRGDAPPPRSRPWRWRRWLGSYGCCCCRRPSTSAAWRCT